MLNNKLARANFRVLSIDISLTHNAIGNDLNHRFDIVGAVLVKPFHYYGVNTGQIEFHHIRTLLFGNVESFKDGIEDVFEHSAVHIVHTQRIELLDRHLKYPLIVFNEGKIRSEVFRGYEY